MVACMYPVSKAYVCSFCRRIEIIWLVVKLCAVLSSCWLDVFVQRHFPNFYTKTKAIYTSVQKQNIIRIWVSWTKELLISDKTWFIVPSVNSRFTYSKFHYLEISDKIQSFPTVSLNFGPVWFNLITKYVFLLFIAEARQLFLKKHLSPT